MTTAYAMLGEPDEAVATGSRRWRSPSAAKTHEPRGMRPVIAHCHFGVGKLHRRTGKGEQAREQLTNAATMCRELDMGFWLE